MQGLSDKHLTKFLSCFVIYVTFILPVIRFDCVACARSAENPSAGGTILHCAPILKFPFDEKIKNINAKSRSHSPLTQSTTEVPGGIKGVTTKNNT